MTKTARILAFSGSAREGSLNKKLLAEAVRLCTDLPATVAHVDLRDYPMPIYDGDLEQRDGLPKPAAALKQLIQDHDALLIASPEHNHSVTALLKNTIDWLSRPAGDALPGNPFSGKVAGLISASPGRFGGAFSVGHLRDILVSRGCLVIPAQCAVAAAHNAFAEDGSLKDKTALEALRTVVAQLVATTNSHAS